ncbi:unnamed protein product [Cunninghamella blakesleeana]
MFKKSAKTKNIRRKIETSDDEIPSEETVVSSTVLKTKTEKKKKKDNKAIGLSFDETEEGDNGDTFLVKKSKASRKLAAGKKLKVPEQTITSEIDNTLSPTTYNDDYLASLRANTPTIPSNLKKVTTLDDTDNSNIDDHDIIAEKFPSTLKAKLGNTAIPDANAIHAAKKKRELLRQGIKVVDNEDGFMPLDDDSGSRLIREDDEVGNDDERDYEQYVGDNITLDKKEAKKLEESRRQNVRDMIEDAQDIGSNDDDDDGNENDDIERWENDLIKHGGIRVKYDDQQGKIIDPFITPNDYHPAIIPEVSAIPTLDDVLKRLDLISNDITHTMKQYESQLTDTRKGITDLKLSGDDLDGEIERGSKRFDYFQSLSNVVNDLGEFLDVKIPELEQLENEAHDIIGIKKEIVDQRRWLDDMDLLKSFAKMPKHILEEDDENMDNEVDEFGRTKESIYSDRSKQRRQSERQERIEKLNLLIEDKDDQDTILQEIGYWSDDNLPESSLENKNEKLDDIQINKLDRLFDDVTDDFKTLEAVKSRFESWKTDFYEDYKMAFGSLSLPGAFEFYVRCEIVAWDPFSDPIEFDTMNWHKTLSTYGIIDGDDQHEDMDIELLNKVIEKVFIKKIQKLLDVWNPISSKETRYAIQAIEQISYYVEKHERSYQNLLLDVEKEIEKPLLKYAQISESCDLLDINENNEKDKQVFIWRQLKYLKNLILWKRYLPKDSIQSLGKIIVHRIIVPLLRPGKNTTDSKLQNEALALYSRLE